MVSVFVKSARCTCCIGATEKERKNKQELLVDIEAKVAAPRNDDISATVSYTDLIETMRRTAALKERCLLETLASDIAYAIQTNHHVQQVRVRILKPAAAAKHNAEELGVEVVQ